MVLDFLQDKLKDIEFTPDVLLLNCGLHDVKISDPSSGNQVPPSLYESNLREIKQITQAREINLTWVRSIFVEEEEHNKRKGFMRYNRDIESYNRIADES